MLTNVRRGVGDVHNPRHPGRHRQAPGRPLSAQRLHRHIEAARLAYRDRDAFIADPAQVDVPMRKLLDPGGPRPHCACSYQRRERAMPAAAGGRGIRCCHRTKIRSTSASSIRTGTRAASSTRCSRDWLALLAERSGVMLQNRGFGFLRPQRGHPNCIAPGKRPTHTIIPEMVMQCGAAAMLYGVMGGALPWALVPDQLLEFGLDIQEAMDMPRVIAVGRQGADRARYSAEISRPAVRPWPRPGN